MDELAVLRADTDRFVQLTRETSLSTDRDDARFRLVRGELSAGGLDATRPAGGAEPAYRAQYDPEYFTSLTAPDDPVLVALGTPATLQWLDWLDDGTTTARFLGDASEGVARAVELRSGEDHVEVGPLLTDTVDPDLSSGWPDNFEDGTLVHDGSPAPTRIETDGATLERLVDAAAIVGDESVPVVVEDGAFQLAVVGDLMHGRGELSATVSGPDCANRYGDGLAAVARTLTGPLELQVVPGGPLAVVQDGADVSRRYVFTQVM